MLADMNQISYIGVFLEGLLSFLSPCILPLIPLYMAYLTSNAKVEKDGVITYKMSKVFFMTLAFVFGITTTYFIMGLGLNLVKEVIADYQDLISIIGGVILIVFAFNQFGWIEIKALNKEKRLDNNIDVSNMNYFKAFGLGFIFSFAWTPCIGPILANVLIVAASKEAVVGNMLILVYCLGFVIPFIILGLFYTKALSFIKAKRSVLMKISKVAAVIILLFGGSMIIEGGSKVIETKQQNIELNNQVIKLESRIEKLEEVIVNGGSEIPEDETSDKVMMYNFELTDQFGKVHKLSDYKGKYIMLNFIATWCGYCREEIPTYEAYHDDEVVKLYVMSDLVNTQNRGTTIEKFIQGRDITIPILNDKNMDLFNFVGIQSFPTVLYVGPDGSVIGLQSGAMMSTDAMAQVTAAAKQIYQEGE